MLARVVMSHDVIHVDTASAWYAPKVFKDRLQIHYITLLCLDVRCHRLMRTGSIGESEPGVVLVAFAG